MGDETMTQPTDAEVEAVARAIWESSSGGQMDWETLDVFTRGGLKRDARAAIIALDEVRGR